MNNNHNALLKSTLFSGISKNEIDSMLNCLSVNTKSYNKNQYILRAGENISSVGMVLSGSVHILKEDFWGNRTIHSEIRPGQIFGETYACLQTEALGVSIIAAEQTEVLYMDIKSVMSTCSLACEFHNRLIRNFISALAGKNLMLTGKMEHITQRSTREKVLSYLSSEAYKNANPSFEIPFNRQQLADYLAVDRSALSKELCKLRDEGILTFSKNRFMLKEHDFN